MPTTAMDTGLGCLIERGRWPSAPANKSLTGVLVRRLRLNDLLIPDLNHDILQCLLAHMRRRDAFQSAMTSRTAYQLALPQYLSQVVLNCTSREKPPFNSKNGVASFCKILADAVRCRALRELTIIWPAADVVRRDWVSGDSYDVLSGIQLVFPKACLLHILSFTQYSSLVSAMSSLSDPIAKLAHLRTLKLCAALTEVVGGMLAQAQTSCRELLLRLSLRSTSIATRSSRRT